MCVYLYTYTHYTHIYYVNKTFILDVINHVTALKITFSNLADAFIQSHSQMRIIEAIKTNKRAISAVRSRLAERSNVFLIISRSIFIVSRLNASVRGSLFLFK